MRIIMTHGYMLSGTGSNIYVQSLCRALVGEGHDVHLLCQEPDPLAYDFVGKSAKADARGIEDLGEQETTLSGALRRSTGPRSGTSYRSMSTTTTRDGA